MLRGRGRFYSNGGGVQKKKDGVRKDKSRADKATGAKIVITACHNCFDQIGDLDKEYNLGIKVVQFKEVITEAMIIPEKFKPVETDDEEAQD